MAFASRLGLPERYFSASAFSPCCKSLSMSQGWLAETAVDHLRSDTSELGTAALGLVTLRPNPATAPATPAGQPKREIRLTKASQVSRVGKEPTAIAVDGVVDTGRAPVINAPQSIAADSGPPPTVGYEPPIHPALRGLIPTFGNGRLWRGMPSAVLLPPSLAPRPAACSEPHVPGYFSCARKLFQWRRDSIYHVVFRCARDSVHLARAIPADCATFLSDSTIR